MKILLSLKRNFFLYLRIVGIVIFIVVLANIDLSAVWLQMKQVQPKYLFLALLFQFFMLLLKGWRWHLMVNNTGSVRSITQSVGEFLESYAIGVITPGRLGELVKVGYHDGTNHKARSGVSILIERGQDFGFFLIFAGSALAFGQMTAVSLSYGLIVITVGGLAIGASMCLGANAMASKMLHRWVPSLFDGNTLFGVPVVARVGFISLFSNIITFLSSYFLALGIGLHAGFLTISGGVALAGLLNAIPVTVLGLGTREVTFLYVFSDYPQASVLAFSGLMLIVVQIGGGVTAMLMGHVALFFSKKIR
jgi:uncharacterized membrane protein YbhN (UPF0104 family)